MKTGIDLIREERYEQIEKHGRTIQSDVDINLNQELAKAAHELLHKHPSIMGFPANWSLHVVSKMAAKPYKERLIIAGALIAAELDRLQTIENTKNETNTF